VNTIYTVNHRSLGVERSLMSARVRVTEGKEGRQPKYSFVFRLEVDKFALYSFRDIQ
jgi:hypothetical protein